jgi:hypothetical protein
MEWTTIYISGKRGFRKEVLESLERSKIPYLPGTPENDSLCLFWMDEKTVLRDFKKAIGSKTVFKYRLRFYLTLEKYTESTADKKEVAFSLREQALISEMTLKQIGKQHYKHSA